MKTRLLIIDGAGSKASIHACAACGPHPRIRRMGSLLLGTNASLL